MATVEVPPVEQVAEGVWSLPIPMPGYLGFICAYAVQARDGVVLIDAGWDSEEAFASLENCLAAAGFTLADVRAVLFTHGHSDHIGLAGRIRAAAGVPLALHAADADPVVQDAQTVDELTQRLERLDDIGMPESERELVARQILEYEAGNEPVVPDRFIFDGDVIELSRGRLIAVHTPGHSRGHICFVHSEAGVVFVGDHVLAEITPHIGASIGSAESPLDDYLSSLRRIAAFGDLLALPGHGPRVTIGPRVEELLAHHAARLEEARAAVAAGNDLALDIAAQMQWSEPFQSYDSFNRYLAGREALAHLILLRRRSELECSETRPYRWRLS